MVSPSFSLSEKLVYNNIAVLSQCPLRLTECDEGCDELVCFIQAELLTRITAVFILCAVKHGPSGP
jgi:hypothetical protein